jgi:hypothetical protein
MEAVGMEAGETAVVGGKALQRPPEPEGVRAIGLASERGDQCRWIKDQVGAQADQPDYLTTSGRPAG